MQGILGQTRNAWSVKKQYLGQSVQWWERANKQLPTNRTANAVKTDIVFYSSRK